MRETFRNPKLLLILCAQIISKPFSEGLRVFSKIHNYIKDISLYYPNELPLGSFDLVVKAAKDIS